LYYSRIGELVRKFTLFFGLRISKTTDVQSLHNFFSKVTPVECDKKLIRIGGEFDGGYLVPDDFEGIEECYSPGVSLISNFEDELTKKGIVCFMSDYSVDGPLIENKLFNFQKKFLGVKNDGVFIRLDEWIRNTSKSDSDKILQMHIEGAEWSVLCTTPPDILEKFRIIVLEVHGMDGLFDPMIFRQINDTFDLLIDKFKIVHIHPNNSSRPISAKGFSVPPVMEFTFLRSDRVKNIKNSVAFPHHLDSPNVKEMRDYPLPRSWYKSK